MMTPGYPRERRRSGKTEATHVAGGLTGAMGPLMRQMRKFAALKACLNLLPEELRGLAAPYDIRLVSADSSPGGQHDGGYSGVSTMFVYVANRTVEAVLANIKQGLVREINAALPVDLVEDLRFEEAPAKKIARQMNILVAEPD